jgi:putative ABC transport system permease protein
MISDYFILAVNSILHRKIRSWLTIIGIIIGVAAIIALISLSLGLKATIEEQFEAFGADRVLVASQGFQGPGTFSEGLTDKDVETLEKLGVFETISSGSAKPGEVEFHNEIKFPMIFGGRNAKELLESGTDLQEGRYIDDNDGFSTLIGSHVADGLFDDKVNIRNKITIAGHKFRVVGILETVGNQQDDNTIYIPLETYREIFNQDNDEVGFISAQVKPGADVNTLRDRVERALERARDDENFAVVTPDQILEQINQILGVIQLVLVGIAAISLIVGAVGITQQS